MPISLGPTAPIANYLRGVSLGTNNAKSRTFTVGGTAADGDYSLAVTYRGVAIGTATFTRADSEDNAGIATGLRAEWDAVAALAAVSAPAAGASTAVVIAWDDFGTDYRITATAPGGATLAVTAASHTLQEDAGQVFLVDTAVATQTVVLPPAASCHDGRSGQVMSFIGLGDADLVLDGSGSETIDGATTATTTDAYVGRTIWTDGTAWYTLT